MSKEKKIQILIAVISIVLIIALCTTAYLYFTKKWVFAEKEEKISTEPIYSAENYPKVDASTATQPLAMAFYKNFTGKDGDFEAMNFSKTHQAYIKLINKEVDLILVTSPSEEELALAKEKGMELEVIPVVREGFVFYVNNENKVDNLTVKEVQDIYSGKIKNWKEVDGEDITIKAYQRPVNSGSQTGMLDLVMKNKKIMESPKEDIVGTMSQIINLVATYTNEASAIGYSYYYYATTMYEEIDPSIANNIKLLSINGIKPEPKTIKDGTYPFTTSYYIVIDKASKEDSPARKLADAMLSTRGQKAASEAKYVPIK
jgi:phosphate transport system substrate-binding protein